MQYTYKYTESKSFMDRCRAAARAMENAKDIEVTDIDSYPLLTIAGKGFYFMTFGIYRAQLFITNIETIKQHAQGSDHQQSLIIHGKAQHVELSLIQCRLIVKYESAIKSFISNPNFLNT